MPRLTSNNLIVFSDVRRRVGLPAIAGGLFPTDALTAVAPANASSRNTGVVAVMSPPETSMLPASGLVASPSASELHETFSWRTAAPHLMSPIVDQGTCGCCWAVAAASMMSDRVAIKTKSANPKLPFQVLMACVESCAVCGTCELQLALDWISAKGLAAASPETQEKQDRLSAWGLPTGQPIDAGSSLTSLSGGGLLPIGSAAKTAMPPIHNAEPLRPAHFCDLVTQVTSVEGGHSWRALGPSKRSATILELQHAILHDGPVATIARIYTDFIIGSDPQLGPAFASTEGVYIHSEGETNYGVAPSANKVLGAHCMVIVGWGVTKTGIRYWEVRNSWGEKWGDKGYCKVAMTSPTMRNSSVGIDVSVVTSRDGLQEANYGNLWMVLASGKGLYGASRAGRAPAFWDFCRPESLKLGLLVCLSTFGIICLLLWLILLSSKQKDCNASSLCSVA